MGETFNLRQFDFPLPQPFSFDKALKTYETPEPGMHHDESWPVLYILTNAQDNTAYIGQTTNYQRRMQQHKSNPEKNFDRSLLIDSEVFNQSTTFDYENKLIELFSADGKYRITNANNGYAQFDYYQRPLYRQNFRKLWEKLRKEHYALHPIEDLQNTDLFKFSPFKTLTPDQYEAIDEIIRQLETEVSDNKKRNEKTLKKRVIIINGQPGTGKTILAISLLFKISNEAEFKGLRVGFITPMASLKRTLRKIAGQLPGLKAGDIMTPSEMTHNDHYDILLVDEAHRLGDRMSVGAGIGAFYNTCDRLGLPREANQIDWIFSCCDKAYIFYDSRQQIRSGGLSLNELETRLNRLEDEGIETEEFNLSTQMRVRGGDEYLDFVYDLLTNKAYTHNGMRFESLFSSQPYDARNGDPNCEYPRYQYSIVSSFQEFCDLQKKKEQESGLSRMLAGYAWKWQSKKEKDCFDICIEGIQKKWNTSQEDWVNTPNAINEIGCIHTIQGYDLNYGFVILGHDIAYDEARERVVVDADHFYDITAKKKATDADLERIIINAYYVLMTRGMLGTFLYVCDPPLRRYLERYIPAI